VTQRGQGHDPNIFGPHIISTTAGDTDFVTTEHQ